MEMHNVLLGKGARVLHRASGTRSRRVRDGHGGSRVDVLYYHGQSSVRRMSPATRQGCFRPRANCRGTCCVRCPCMHDVARYEGHQLFVVNKVTFAFTVQSLVNNTLRI
eukprot:6305615-Pyramimonas_sp.AAC.1